MKFITIKDISKKLGISHQTVSRALNNDPRVKKETSQKIKLLAAKMHYLPNVAARNLARTKSNTIAVITFSYYSHFPTAIMSGIEPIIRKTNYDFDYYTTQKFTFTGRDGKESYLFEKILDERKASAVILISINMSEQILMRYKKAGIHVVFLEVKNSWGHRVHYDNEKAAELAIDHFIERGRKNVGIFIGNTHTVKSFNERMIGFKKAMQKHGLRVSKKNIFEFYEEPPNVCKKALHFFLENKIDAIYLAGSDAYLPDFLEELRKTGLKIPDDIAIISQDDVAIPLAADITAIKQPIMEMGKKAAEIAISAIEKNDFKNMQDVIFYPELIVRKST
ncbi:MAG: LacI family DNA-binding transcriptional regulator [Candidatus Goldbacteria bacterium]|nr:LacI family DNA-binding transcriptional regulator [Candidatus Goldiibacteriota bacterium]